MSENQFEQPNTPENNEPGATALPPRPLTPPAAQPTPVTPPAAPENGEAVSKVEGAVEQTQAIPRHSHAAAPDAPTNATGANIPPAPEAGSSPYGGSHVAPPAHAPYGTPTPAEHSSAFGVPSPVAPARSSAPKKFTSGVLILGMVAAALVGAGSAVGANAIMNPASASSSANNTPQNGVVINNPKNVTAVTAAAAKASPSVVTIDVSGGSQAGSGSGIILDTQGHILTNTHVVTLGGATADPKIAVQTSNGQVYNATLVGTDPLSDLAIIKIDAQGLTPAALGNSSDLNVGDTAIAIGAPLGLSGTVTDGIVSTLNRTISVASSAAPKQSEGTDPNNGNQFNFQFPGAPQTQTPTSSAGAIFINVIQTDAAINHGNSGGALVDVNGNIIGVNVAIASSGSSASDSSDSGSIGVGFAIPIDYAKRIAQDLIDNGKATHGLLGVSVAAKPADVKDGNSSFSVGAQVKEVVAGSAGEKAGLKVGDVITGVGERVISDSSSLTAAIREIPAGGKVTIHYTRNGQSASTDATVGTSPAS